MNSAVRTKLSIMMFLEIFIWGAWLPTFAAYLTSLGFNADQKTWIQNAFSIGAITAMFFSTPFVDRHFAAEKFLAFSHLIGGLAMIALAWVGYIGDVNTRFWVFFALMLVHCLFYVPTISITNAIAFANVQDAQKDFGPIRLWGTIGWIAASWPFIFILVDWTKIPPIGEGFVTWLGSVLDSKNALSGAALTEGRRFTFIAAGGASLLLAAFSLTLPHTPPKRSATGEGEIPWLEAFKLLANPYLLVLFVVTFLDAAVHEGYFMLAGGYLGEIGIPGNWIMPVMSIGQIAEIGTMAVLGYFLKSLGWKWTMIIGVLGHTVRFGVFAFLPYPWLAVVVNVLHGICYAFFFATVYIFVDEFFPKDVRASAQGLFNLLILGLGPIAAHFAWNYLEGVYTVDKVVNYRTLFLYPAATGLIGSMILLLFFYPPKKAEKAY